MMLENRAKKIHNHWNMIKQIKTNNLTMASSLKWCWDHELFVIFQIVHTTKSKIYRNSIISNSNLTNEVRK